MNIWSVEAGHADHPLIVMVHGAMDRAASMLKLSRRLDEQYRVLRYDRRGYGRSVPHAGPFNVIAQVADLVELLAGRRAVLVGHSYGGNVAMAAAAQHRELVAGVVVYESPLPWEPFWPPSTAGWAAIQAAGPTKDAVADAAEMFMRRLIGDERWLALPEQTRLSRRSEGLALVSELSDLHEHRPWEAADIKVPLILGYGSRTAEHRRHGMTYIADSVAGAEALCLQDCGHNAHRSAPDQFRDELIEPLLRRVGAPWS